METRMIEVSLSEEAARRYDDAITGGDDDVLLAVEKTIMATIAPGRIVRGGDVEVLTDPDIVAVEAG